MDEPYLANAHEHAGTQDAHVGEKCIAAPPLAPFSRPLKESHCAYNTNDNKRTEAGKVVSIEAG